MPATFVTTWSGVGLFTGALLMIFYQTLVTSTQPAPYTARFAATLLTGLLFGALAWHLGDRFDLLPCSVLASLLVTLGLVDLLEQRLPSVLVYASAISVGGLLAASAVLDSRESDFLRAVAGMAVSGALYLILAVASNGGLGAGDVKLGAVVGLGLGWWGWATLLTGVLFGWLLAAAGHLILRAAGRVTGDAIPLGPYLGAGAMAAVLLTGPI
jgi:leader peptidase (prepilin peptidase)/N-methyltransferase